MQAQANPALTPAAVWLRVSTDEQDHENQLPALQAFAAHHGYEIVQVYELDDSAWKDDAGGPLYRATLKRTIADAHAGQFKVLAVWALDRLTRLGAEDALRLIRLFRQAGATVVSVQEPWLNSSPEIADVLVAFAGWNAQQESRRKSERVKIALAKRKAAGLPVGRQPGAKDKRARRRSGYVATWEAGGRRRMLDQAGTVGQPR
jgi:DNA invertase Pin-like site-specific DNA recombinase